MPEAYKMPEWRRLYDALKDQAEPGQVYDYRRLQELMGTNPQMLRGRTQFLRFAKEMLVTRQLYFENVRGQGYRVIAASEHGTSAHKQLKRARVRVREGARIAANVRVEQLTIEQRAANADILCRLAGLERMLSQQGKAIHQLASGAKPERLPPALPNGDESTKVQ